MRVIRITVIDMPSMPEPAAPTPLPDAPLARDERRSNAATVAHDARRRLRSDELFVGGQEVQIEHAGAVYRLRITSLGKLILTK